jgi:hypothetical protein
MQMPAPQTIAQRIAHDAPKLTQHCVIDDWSAKRSTGQLLHMPAALSGILFMSC